MTGWRRSGKSARRPSEPTREESLNQNLHISVQMSQRRGDADLECLNR